MAPKAMSGPLATFDADYFAFYAANVLALSILAASFVSATWMISSIIRSKRYSSIGDRFPLYLAVCDVGFTICHSIDHSYLLAMRRLPDRWLCSLLGAFLQLWLGSGITMAALAAITIYLRVYQEYQVTWGSYEWRFLTLAFGLNTACIAAGFAVGNVFGPAKFWCYIEDGTNQGKICNIIFNTVPVATAFAVCAFCYGMVYWKIVMYSKQMKDVTSAVLRQRRKGATTQLEANAGTEIVKTVSMAGSERAATTSIVNVPLAGSEIRRKKPIVKMMGYLAGYLVRWFVAVIFALTRLADKDDTDNTFLYVGTIATVNAGGVIHALGYWYSSRADKPPTRIRPRTGLGENSSETSQRLFTTSLQPPVDQGSKDRNGSG